MPERKDGDKTIVTGYSGGSHFPRTEAETELFWEADGTSKDGPFTIEGSIYGRLLKFIGPGEVGGVVVGRGDITLKNHGDKLQRFLRGMTAQGSITVASNPRKLENTLMGGLNNTRYVIRGDITANDKIILEDTIVFGSVRAKKIELRQCIVIGTLGDSNTESIDIMASSILHYHAKEVTFRGPCTFLDATGVSLYKPICQPHHIGQTKYPSDLRYYPVFRNKTAFTLGNQNWTEQSTWSKEYIQSKITPKSDFKQLNSKASPVAHSKARDSSFYALSLGGRILDFRPVEQSIKVFRKMLQEGLEFEHYTDAWRATVVERWGTKDEMTTDEKLLMKWITTPVSPEHSF